MKYLDGFSNAGKWPYPQLNDEIDDFNDSMEEAPDAVKDDARGGETKCSPIRPIEVIYFHHSSVMDLSSSRENVDSEV